MPDVTLNIIVPNAWTIKVLDAFNIITDTHITIEARGNPGNEFDGHWDFRIKEKLPTENNKQFGERVLRELGKAIVNMVDKAEDSVRYRNEVATIIPPSSDVPENILS